MKYLLMLPLLSACSTLQGTHHFDVLKNVVYKTVDGQSLVTDIYMPEGENVKPAVIVVHGGGWRRRTGDMSSICRDLAYNGFVAFNVTYRLAPKSHYPAPVEDVKDAIAWVKTNAQKYHVDSLKISGWGYSAGANLILLAGLDTHLGLRAIVSGGTPGDLTVWPDSGLAVDYIGASLKAKPDLWKAASPINHVVADSPPLFMYHGAWDWIVEPEQMQKMVTAMKAKDRVVETHTVNMMGHLAVYSLSQESVDLGIQFIQKYTQ